MKDYIEERAVEIANYIIETKATVRQAAKKFGISKSTVHKDLSERLLKINPVLAKEVRKILDKNKLIKSSTCAKIYLKMNQHDFKSNVYILNKKMDLKTIFKAIEGKDKKYISNSDDFYFHNFIFCGFML